MERASFYTNASGSRGPRPGRLTDSAIEDLPIRGYSAAATVHQSGVASRSSETGPYQPKHSLPPIVPRDAEDRAYEGFSRPQPRYAWDNLARGPYPAHPSALPTASAAPRLGRTPSPPPALLSTGRHLPPLGLERSSFSAPLHSRMLVADRDAPSSRAIAFEESHIAAPMKRPRVSLACLACRNRKSRCDGNRPTCKTCAHMKIDCKWPEVDFRRAKSGDAARHRRKGAGIGTSARSPSSGAPTISHEMRHHPAMRPAEAPRSMARLPSPLVDRSGGSMMESSAATFHPYARARMDSSLPPLGRSERSDVLGSFRDGRRPGSPSERYLLSHAAGSDPRPVHHLATNMRRPEGFTPSLGSVSSDGLAADVADGDRSPLKPSPISPPYWWSKPMSADSAVPVPKAASSGRLSAARSRDIAARLLALLNVDPVLDRHGLPKHGDPASGRNSPQRHQIKHEAERLDEVFAIDWERLGVSRSALTREFTDAMAGTTAYLQLFEDGSMQSAAQPRRHAVLHLFQSSSSALEAHPRVRRISLSLELPDDVQQRLLRQPVGLALPLRDLDLDLAERFTMLSPRLDAVSLTHLAVDFSQDRERQPSDGGLPAEMPEEMMSELFDGAIPKLSILQEVLDITLDQMNGIYLFLDRRALDKKIQDRTASPVLLNAVCGLGSRFARRRFIGQFSAVRCGEAFARRAHQLFWQAVTYPTSDAVNAGVLLAVCEVGAGRVTSASTIAAATSRMAIQLGLHRVPPPGSSLSEEERLSDQFLFWAAYAIDRITSLMTGRPCAMQDRDIDARLPSLSNSVKVSSFGYMIDLVRISCSKISSSLFSPVHGGSADEVEQIQAERLASIYAEMNQWYDALPSWLQFDVDNLQRAARGDDCAIYCVIHLCYYCGFLWINLLDPSLPATSRGLAQMRHAAYNIVHISTLCMEQEGVALASLPLMTPAYFLAACVLIGDLEQLGELDQDLLLKPRHRSRDRYASPSREDDDVERAHAGLQTCLTILEERSIYWTDASAAIDVLRKYIAAHQSRKLHEENLPELLKQLRYIVILGDDVGPELSEELSGGAAGTVTEDIQEMRQLLPFFPSLFK
ncbi:hypothetical protein ACQY0O_001258 [Thecaphora frezii]